MDPHVSESNTVYFVNKQSNDRELSGLNPIRHSRMMMPREKMSDLKSVCCPHANSGEI